MKSTKQPSLRWKVLTLTALICLYNKALWLWVRYKVKYRVGTYRFLD